MSEPAAHADAAPTDPLLRWGWDDGWSAWFESLHVVDDEQSPARVVTEHKGYVEVAGRSGTHLATVSGRLRHDAADARGLPAVGDWVVHGHPDDDGRVRVDHVAPRRTAVVRRAAGNDPEPQVVAANVDLVFVVSAFDGDINPRRIERYLAVIGASGAAAEIVLTKLDLIDDAEPSIAAIAAVTEDQPIHLVSNVSGAGLDELAARIPVGSTVALVGSSGVGKSTIVNQLLGRSRQETADVRDDGRGRHTTTRRELVPLPDGAVLLDTPGMRELQLWDTASLEDAFPEIIELGRSCRFADCGHAGEPGCSVAEAVEAGELSERRFSSFRRLREELDDLERQHVERGRRRGGSRRR